MGERAFVIGDLHLGAGRGDPLEDFFDDEALAHFAERIAGAETTLYLNGDVIDFAQIPPFEVPRPAHLLWGEAASLAKLEAALAGHPDFFRALARFLASGARLHVLVGNHDLDLAWPRVQARLRAALGDPPGDRFAVSIGAARWAGVHIEHGYQFTPENCPRDPERFFHEERGATYLERVWGTDFMLQFYNRLERDHPFADNVKPTLAIAWYGIRNRWVGGREIVRLLLFLKRRGLPWRALLDAVLAPAGPVDAATMAGSFADPSWQRAVAERASTDPAFMAEVQAEAAALDDQERALLLAPEQVTLVDPRLDPGETAATLGLFRDDRERRAARDRLSSPGVTAVVFGHTHAIVDGELDRRLFNPGTWLPHLDLASPRVRELIARSGVTLEMLSDRSLYAVDRRAVRIDAGHPASVELVSCD
jgi:hypothetical protein